MNVLLTLGADTLEFVLVPMAYMCAAGASIILLWFLFFRPALTPITKVILFFGLGLFPIGLGFSGNVVDFEKTAKRDFCNGCHVMNPWIDDATNPQSKSLAAMHTRNHEFGEKSCYTCHSNYAMFGTVLTKLGGMRHVWEYVTKFRKFSIEEAIPQIELYEPFPNATCMRCHSTTLPAFLAVGDHGGSIDRLRAGSISCASEGCHGPAHPFASRTAPPAEAVR